jgi:hypothetical protein
LSWLIVKTTARKESAVAEAIRGLGFEAWVPCQLVPVRQHASRRVTSKAHLVKIREIALLPRRVFVKLPENSLAYALYADIMGVRYLSGLELGPASTPIRIDSEQLIQFKDAIDGENTAALALVAAKTRKQKAQWRSLQEALIDLVDSAKKKMGPPS